MKIRPLIVSGIDTRHTISYHVGCDTAALFRDDTLKGTNVFFFFINRLVTSYYLYCHVLWLYTTCLCHLVVLSGAKSFEFVWINL